MKCCLRRPTDIVTMQSRREHPRQLIVGVAMPPPLGTCILRMKNPHSVTAFFESSCHVLEKSFHSSKAVNRPRRQYEDFVLQRRQLPGLDSGITHKLPNAYRLAVSEKLPVRLVKNPRYNPQKYSRDDPLHPAESPRSSSPRGIPFSGCEKPTCRPKEYRTNRSHKFAASS